MERKTCVIAVLLLLSISAIQGNNNYKLDIYNAYVNGDMNKWAQIVKSIENSGTAKTTEQNLELIEYYYGLTAYLIGTKKEKQAKVIISKADLILNKLIKANPKNATINAFKGSFTAFKIAIDKYKVVVLGTESMKYLNQAYKLNPNDIQANIDKGNALFHAPGFAAGDKNEALKLFNNAILLMEKTNKDDKNWLYLNVLVQTAQAYSDIDKKDIAIKILEKALKKEPAFTWIKDEIYPEILKK
jgi:tetratricopeptide (TPR) repeat protein